MLARVVCWHCGAKSPLRFPCWRQFTIAFTIDFYLVFLCEFVIFLLLPFSFGAVVVRIIQIVTCYDNGLVPLLVCASVCSFGGEMERRKATRKGEMKWI